ncbi:MAG: hypothetical protein JNL28_07355 [Planctomycetes bacterium]|nr:hypothetical protein [Planctomycetota bacterium]
MNADSLPPPDRSRARRPDLREPEHHIDACIAVDWSGAIATVRTRLWLAESRANRLVRVECGFDRPSLVRHLIACAERDPSLVVGLDFAFAFPLWFTEHLGAESARELWEIVARKAEMWLARCPSPFWGKPYVRCPPRARDRNPLRRTEEEHVPVGGQGPKSVFQIGGAGTVGTGSLRGMPYLRELQDAGFAIWPFDAPRLPMVVELYPRYLTGKVHKASLIARALYIQAHHAHESREMQDLAACSEDAFDAAVSAACMQRFARDFPRIADHPRSRIDRLEGRIWKPLRDPVFERW